MSRKIKLQHLKAYQRYTAYPENDGFTFHWTGGCLRLELSNIFKKLHNNFLFGAVVLASEYTYGWYSASILGNK
jgi:hypothetical protein